MVGGLSERSRRATGDALPGGETYSFEGSEGFWWSGCKGLSIGVTGGRLASQWLGDRIGRAFVNGRLRRVRISHPAGRPPSRQRPFHRRIPRFRSGKSLSGNGLNDLRGVFGDDRIVTQGDSYGASRRTLRPTLNANFPGPIPGTSRRHELYSAGCPFRVT